MIFPHSLNGRPEFELLVCLARVTLGPSDDSRARELMRAGIDWDYFLALAWRHGLMPLTNKHLLEAFADYLPPAHLEKARSDFRHNTARNLLLASELCSVLEEFERLGIAAVAYKGPALAQQLYGDLRLRSFRDLDVLVRPDDVKQAGEALAALGYRPELHLTRAQEAMLSRSQCDRVYLKDEGRFMFELHWAVTRPFFSFRVGTQDLLNTSECVELCGRQLRVPAPEMLLLLLCVHATKDLWLALEPVCAISELLRTRPDLDWQRVAQVARRAGALRRLLVGLQLAGKLFEAHLPEIIVRLVERNPAVRELTTQSLHNVTREHASKPELIEKTSFCIRSMERRRDRLRYRALPLIAPTYKDCVPELPTSLGFIYYGVRPIRLLRDHLKA